MRYEEWKRSEMANGMERRNKEQEEKKDRKNKEQEQQKIELERRKKEEQDRGRLEQEKLNLEKIKKKEEEKLKYDRKKASVEKLKMRADREFKSTNYNKAAADYSEAIRLSECNGLPTVVLHNNRAACYLQLGNFNKTIEDCKVTLQSEPQNYKAQMRYLRSCINLGKIIEGKEFTKTLDKSDKKTSSMITELNDIEILTTEARVALDKNLFEKALTKICDGLNLSTHNSSFLIMKAECLVKCPDHNSSEAQTILNEIKKQDSSCINKPGYRFVSGLCLYYQADLDRAVGEFNRVKNKIEETSVWLIKAIEMNRVLETLNEVLKSNQKIDLPKALSKCDDGLSVDPSNESYSVKMLYLRALINLKFEQLDASIKDLSKALEIDKRNCSCLFKRGSVYFQMNKHEEAIDDLQKSYDLNPTSEARTKIEEVKKAKKIFGNINQTKQRTYYEILGVETSSSSEQIRKAYRTKAREFHPDKHAQASGNTQKLMEAEMKLISAANQCLSDPRKRLEYDQTLEIMADNDFDSDEYDQDNYNDFDNFDAIRLFMFEHLLRTGAFFHQRDNW